MFVYLAQLFFPTVYEHGPKYACGLCTGILQKFFPAYTGAKIPGAHIPIELGMCNSNASCTWKHTSTSGARRDDSNRTAELWSATAPQGRNTASKQWDPEG